MILKRKTRLLLFSVCLSQILFSQNKIEKLILNDSSVTINNTLIYKSHVIYLDYISELKRILPGEKIIQIKNNVFGGWDYYFVNSGIEIRTSERNKGIIQITVFFKKNELIPAKVRRKMRVFDGSIDFYGTAIDKNSTLLRLNGLEKFADCSKQKTKNVICFDNDLFYCPVFFENDSPSAGILNMSIEW